MEDQARPVVLVVDDDEDHVTMLEAALGAFGYSVLTAFSCGEARRVLEARSVDALVTDLTLGDGTSLDLVRGAGTRKPRVSIVLSGFDGPEDLVRTHDAGFDAHLVKPAAIEDVAHAIAAGLAKAHA